MSQEYTLTRTGDAPLKFSGEKIAEAGGRIHSGQEMTRWHELAVYKTAGGKYVTEIVYYTQWQGESSHHGVRVTDDIQGAVSYLRSEDPIEHAIGYPLGDAYAEKQERLMNSLRQRYAVLLTEVLEQIPEAVEEIE